MAIVSNTNAQPTGKEPMIMMRDVEKWYGAFYALKKVNLTVAKGEKIVLCGPSGSGKSTLIRCINRLEASQGGEIVVSGHTVKDDQKAIDAVRREVGMVFQQFNLFPHKTVLENCILAPMRVRKLSRPEAEKTARKYLERVRIGDQADKYPAQLSGGQQQRVAIARTLAMEPKALLFDEPTSALDPEMVGEVLDVMRGLAHTGVTMIVVTHEMGFARNVANTVTFMEAGKVVETGPASEVLSAPKSARTAEFIRAVHN